MKLDIRRLTRPIIAGVCIGVILAFVIWLSHPLGILQNSPSQPSAAQVEPGGPPPSPQHKPGSPDINPAAFKDLGNLAFVWQGLLYVLDGKTGEARQLTESGKAYYPVWSHDGQWLAFVSVTDPQAMSGSLWLVRRDGTQSHQVQGLSEPVIGRQFSWSPSADVLAVSGRNGVWLVPAEGEPRQFEGATEPFWSPDGKSLAYSVTLPSDDPVNRSDELYTVAVDGGQPVKHILAPNAGIQVVAWWADGKGLLYWLDPLHSASLAADGMGLMSLRLGNSEPKPLATGLAHREWLSFSPQGRLLMVAGGGRIVWAEKRLAVINVESGSVQELKNPGGCVALDPSFSPDGRRIAFVAAKNLGSNVWGFSKPDELSTWLATRTLWIENADGSGAHPLQSAGAGVYQPVWSRDGSHIMYVRDNAIWIIGSDGGKPEKVLGNFTEQKDLFGFYGFVSYHDAIAWYQ